MDGATSIMRSPAFALFNSSTGNSRAPQASWPQCWTPKDRRAIALYRRAQQIAKVLNNLADTWISWGRLRIPRHLAVAIGLPGKALEYTIQAAEVAPRDFGVAFRQDGAMSALAAALEKQRRGDAEARQLPQRLLDP